MARNKIQHSDRHVKVGRPSAYSIELAQKIADSAALGMYLQEAADEYQIPYETISQWLDDHDEFNDLIATARAVHLKGLLLKLKNSDDGKDTHFLLERTFPDNRFVDPRVGLQLNMVQNNMTVVPGLGMSQDELRQERERLDKLQAVPGKPGQLNPAIGSNPADLDAYIAHLQKIRAELPDTPRDVTPSPGVGTM